MIVWMVSFIHRLQGFSLSKMDQGEAGQQLLGGRCSGMNGQVTGWKVAGHAVNTQLSLCLHSGALQASEDDHRLCMKCMDLNSRLDTFVKVLINVLIIMTV